jgi:hypothetical protein
MPIQRSLVEGYKRWYVVCDARCNMDAGMIYACGEIKPNVASKGGIAARSDGM